MPGIRILTDSTADLTRELIERYSLIVVPLVVQFDQESYRDGVDIDIQSLFRLVEKHGQLPKTASPSPGAFKEAFEQATADGSQAIYIGLSTHLSSTVQNARIAADLFPAGQVRVFDSANLSTGIGLLVLYAADLARAGKNADEIMAALEEARPKVRSSFVIDTLEYLYKGGRCSGVQALVGSLLKLRPVIAVVDGRMEVATKVRGARHKGFDYMLAEFEQHASQGLVRPERVFVTHTGTPDDAAFLMGEIQRIMPGVQATIETPAGSVIGSHCGPGTIGILYMLK